MNSALSKYLPLLATVFIVAAAAYVRIRLLPVPLERDEGEYAYMGQLLLNGASPYVHAYSMKLPGVSIAYALIMALFGQTPSGIHLGLMLVNLASTCLLYLLTKRLFNNDTACLAAASFALLSLSKTVYGFFAHATHFVVLFTLAGLLLLLRSLEKRRLAEFLGGGLCLGLAVLMKQHAALLALFGLLYLLWSGYFSPDSKNTGRLPPGALLLFLAGLLLPYFLLMLWIFRAGTFDTFWFWTVTYARDYAAGLGLEEGLQALTHNFSIIYAPNPLLWVLAGVGLLTLFMKKEAAASRLFLAGLLAFSFLAVCPGLYFRWHYFIMILPAAAMLIGCGATTLADRIVPDTPSARPLKSLLPFALVIPIIAYGFYKERICFFKLTPEQVSYSTYGKSPFPVAPEIGRYLNEHTNPDSRIAVLGSEPEIYFYAGRPAATAHIYMYSLMEVHPHAEQMQLELIRDIEQSRPEYCVFVDLPFSWLAGVASHRHIFRWFDSYVKERYQQVGVVELYDNSARFYWDGEAAQHRPDSEDSIIIYRRKP